MIEIINISIHASLIAIIWVYLLTEEGGLFSWWPQIVHRCTDNIMVIKIAYECEKCLAGQIALWWGLAVFRWDIWSAVCASLYAMILSYIAGILVQKLEQL